jgi:L-lactate dehydrogenase complex protein LldF
MDVKSNDFVAIADIAIANPELQKAVALGTYNGYSKRLHAMFVDGQDHGELLRQQAKEAKRRALRDLPELLEKAEANLIANGFDVLWAADADEANRLTLEIIQRHGARLISKGKSMLTEEIGLNHAVEAAGMRVVETDLGEYIIQLNNEPPSHIIAPVIHKTKDEIRDIFIEKLGMESTDDAGTMVAFARDKLREEFVTADLGISGGNFLIAETGSLSLVENEGNGRMCTTMPNVHIAFIGIEKIVATLEDYAVLNQLIARSGTGQTMAVYSNIINGPRRPDEVDGPEHVYIILVDNGRSRIYGTDYAEALACIRCGACLNACPVYRSTGGHAYGWVYSGPIGAVLTPLFVGLENAKPLPYASSLCGACKQACPVDIDLPRMLLDLRADEVEEDITSPLWDTAMRLWSIGMESRWRYELGGTAARAAQPIANSVLGHRMPGVLGHWTQNRDFPEFAPKPFRQLWKEREQKKKANGES